MSEVYVNEPSTSGKVVLRTSLGDLDIELWSRECPVACRNFLQLCCDGYYNGLIFHRVIKDFIVQTGDPTGTGRGGSDTAVNNGKLFDLEIHPRLKFRYRGLVGVANLTGGALAGAAGGRGCGTNGNQFFITLARCDALNNTHTLFGKVTGHSLYNLMKFGELEIDKNDRPVCPPIVKGVDVLWMPFPDIQPRVELQQQQLKQQERSSGDRRGDGEDESGGATREEQQKRKLQKPDKKLLSFAEEEDEEEQGEDEGAGAAEGKKKQERREERTSTSRSEESRAAGAIPPGKTGNSKKILSAHDVLEDDPLLQRSSGPEAEAAAAQKWNTDARRADTARGRGSTSETFVSDGNEEEEERRQLHSKQRKRRRSSSNRSSSSEHSSEDSSSDPHNSDDSSSRVARNRRSSVGRRDVRGRSSRKDGDEGVSSSSSTLTLVRNKLAALAAAEGSDRRHRYAGTAAAAGGEGEETVRSGSRNYPDDDDDDDRSRSARSSSVNEEQQQHREKKEGRRKVEALRLWAGGGSASRGSHADRERLQDSDLMTESEKKRQLYVLRKRDAGRQRQQTDTLKKLDAFTQQVSFSIKEKGSLKHREGASNGNSNREKAGQQHRRDTSNSSSKRTSSSTDTARTASQEKQRRSKGAEAAVRANKSQQQQQHSSCSSRCLGQKNPLRGGRNDEEREGKILKKQISSLVFSAENPRRCLCELRSLRERQSSGTADGSRSSAAPRDSGSSREGEERSRNGVSSGADARKESGVRPTSERAEKATKTAEPGTLNALLPDLDEEIDENDGSWLSGGGLRFAVDSNRAYELDEARAAASVVVYDPLRGAGDLATKKMQQRRQQQAVAWKEGRRDIEKW